jgi:23S rRNA (uracil1939-C5)-methyltransferase
MKVNGSDSQTLEVEIERILPGGLGMAHAAGQTILVSLAAPGDHLRVKIERVRGNVTFASVAEILRPSPQRVEPPCPYFGRCGGCNFQQLGYEAQLQAKVEIVRDCLRRIARIPNLPEIAVTPSAKQWRYRSRARWQVDAASVRVGYYEQGSHTVCDVADCAVLVPELQEALESVRQCLPDRLPAGVNELEVVAGEAELSVSPPLAQFQTLEVRRRIGRETYRFNATSFFQINHDLLEALITDVMTRSQGERALDLYCGVGLFTVPLARKFSHVVGIESNPDASSYARRNLHTAGLVNAKIITARVATWLRKDARMMESIDLLVLDPPRTGAESEVVQNIVKLRPTRIIYVSCDPATLARDLRELLASGYKIESIKMFDMFPQTHHVETVVHLVRTD